MELDIQKKKQTTNNSYTCRVMASVGKEMGNLDTIKIKFFAFWK